MVNPRLFVRVYPKRNSDESDSYALTIYISDADASDFKTLNGCRKRRYHQPLTGSGLYQK